MKDNIFDDLEQDVLFDWDKYLSSIRRQIYTYMDANNMTVRQFIDESHIPKSTICNLLYGSPTDCKASTLIPLAKFLKISMEELLDCDTIAEPVLNNIITCRTLPPNAIFLIRWFIDHQAALYKRDLENNEKMISVMMPLITNDGIMRVSDVFNQIDISNLSEELQHKVFIGLRISTDYYMPYYTPYDIVLIANDRRSFPREHVLVVIKEDIFLAKRRVEDGVVKYYGILDDKFRCDSSGITEEIGYITGKIPDTSEEGRR